MSIYYYLLLFTIILKVAFWLIKPRWYLDNKLIAFQQFSSNDSLNGIKASFLISSTFVSILCVQDKTLKVLLKVIKDLFLLLRPKWYVDNKLIDFQQLCSNGKALTVGTFSFRKLSVDFRRFRVFVFYHRARSKTWNLRKILL